MDIMAYGDGWAFPVMGFSKFEYGTNKDGSLSLRAKKETVVSVETRYGTFLEVANEAGDVVQTGGDGQWFRVALGKTPVTLRRKTLPPLTLSAAQMNKRRQTVTRYLVSDQPWNVKLPDTLVGAIKWMQAHLDSIPESCRAKAHFRFDTTTEYGETYPQIEITYTERETDEELVRRLQIEAERTRITEEGERARLKSLQAKYAAE